MTVSSDKVEIILQGKDLLSAELNEATAAARRFREEVAQLADLQAEQPAVLKDLTTGNDEVTDALEEQAQAARTLYNLQLELGVRAADSEEERLDLARQALAMEREGTLAQLDAIGATNEQRRAIDSLFMRMDMQIQSQLEATRATKDGAAATQSISVAARAAQFGFGIMEKALVSLKRALFIAPLVAGVQLLTTALVEAVAGLFDFGDEAESAADKVARLREEQEKLTTAIEGARNASGRAIYFGKHGQFDLQEVALHRQANAVQKQIEAIIDGSQSIDLELLQSLVMVPRTITGPAIASANAENVKRRMRDGDDYQHVSASVSWEAAWPLLDDRLAQLTKAIETAGRDGAMSEEMFRFGQLRQGLTPLEGGALGGLPFDPRAPLGPGQLDAALSAEVGRMATMQIRAYVEAGLGMAADGVGGATGIPGLLGVPVPAGTQGPLFDLDSAIQAEQQRLAAEAQAMREQGIAAEQLNHFTAERLALLQQVELTQEEQVGLINMQVDAQQASLAALREGGHITEEQLAVLAALLERIRGERIGGLGDGPVAPLASRGWAALDFKKTAEDQYLGAVESLDDTVVRDFSTALVDISTDFDRAGEAAKEFGRDVVSALQQIVAQKLALAIIEAILGTGGALSAGMSASSGGGGGGGYPSGFAFLSSGGGGGGGGGGGSSGFSAGGGYGGGSSLAAGVTIHVHVPVSVHALDTRDFKARVSEISRHVGDTVARELDTNRGLQQTARRIARSSS